MNTLHRFFVTGLFAGLSLIHTSTAAAESMYYSPQQHAPQQYQQQAQQRSYGHKVGDKAKNGITNVTTSWLEIPKSVINNTNAQGSNIFFGLVGGIIEGGLNTAFRATTGAIDLVTSPLATKPIAQPRYIWDDFDSMTTYRDAFRLDDND